MNKMKISNSQLELLKTGHTIEDGVDSYYHFPFWVKPIDFNPDNEGHVVEVLTRNQIPGIQSSYKQGGLHVNKYNISKRNGEDVDPNAWYFVLRIDKDPHARKAAMEYAKSVGPENPKLALELMDALTRYEPEMKEFSDTWTKYYPYKILDPDGWDRSNWIISWEETRYTWEEFCQKAMMSTCVDKREDKDAS